MAAFPHLLSSGRIGSLILRNRLVMPAMGTNFASEGGFVTQRQIEYYEARARGGVGLIVVELASIDFDLGRGTRYQLNIDGDSCLPGLSRLTAAIHRHGARCAVQVFHAGRVAKCLPANAVPVGPSELAAPGFVTPRELTGAEIEGIVDRFVAASERARRAGFDGIEVHAAHGFLLTQFLSPASNRRLDQYGGDSEGRARFLLKVISAIKERLGAGFPVWCRLDGREQGMEGGITPEMASKTALLVQGYGADAISVSAYGFGTNMTTTVPLSGNDLRDLAAFVKQGLSIPVIAVGRIDPETGDRMISEAKADFVGIGRGLLTEPGFSNWISQEQADNCRPCIACYQCVESEMIKGEPIRCSVNPMLGREGDGLPGVPARSKAVLVVGGGPGGMEAARVAALRGHKVTLCERHSKLGGKMNIAMLPPHKESVGPYIRFQARQLARLGVVVLLNTAVTLGTVLQIRPDVVVLATGSTPLIPSIPGLAGAMLAEDVLLGRTEVKGEVVVIGGELVGCEVAEFMAERGEHVTVTRRGPRMATKMPLCLRLAMLKRLNDKGVVMCPGLEYRQVEAGRGLVASKEGRDIFIPADSFVLAAGAVANGSLFADMKKTGIETIAIGDCVAPRDILSAVDEGFKAGSGI